MEKLLEKVKDAKTKMQKQELSAFIISELPRYLQELGEAEQIYSTGRRRCIETEGSVSRGDMLVEETDYYKEYKYKKHIYDNAILAVRVLGMYTEK